MYLKEAFDPESFEHAKDIVLSPDKARPHKFVEETQFLVDFMVEKKLVTKDSQVLDFGCGMGRISKTLIDTCECKVTGVDISPRMLVFARQYVQNPTLFTPILAIPDWTSDVQSVDVAVAAFVLQHAENPEAAVAQLSSVLKPGGTLVLLDDGKRFVPGGVDAQGFVVWQDDGVVVTDLISRYFVLEDWYPYCNRHEQVLSVWKKK